MLSSRFTRARKGNGLRTALLSGLVALFALATTASFGSATANAESDSNAQKYYGYWNYDQPDITTLNNVAVLACPDGTGQCGSPLPLPLPIPQIGWVLFSAGPNGTVNGHTDQGCTWNFRVTRTGLELSSTTQQCFNQNIGSAGNIIKWSVTVNGNKEQEQIVAVSHQPNGVDLLATMNSGSRTKVNGTGGTRHIHRFLGDYSYDPADFRTLTNVVSTDKGTVYPEQGTVHFTSKGKGRINAHTPDGCDWTLVVHGDTAELDPATQTCHTASGDSSLRYWALVTDDGKHMSGFRAGSTTTNGQTPTNTYLFVGAMTRSAI